MVCRRLMLLNHEGPGWDTADHELLVSFDPGRRRLNVRDSLSRSQPRYEITN
jgi:hypothetical protein